MEGNKDCCSTNKAEQCRSKENTDVQFNTRRLPAARGHIVHSWDILLDIYGSAWLGDHVAAIVGGHPQVTDNKFSVIWFSRRKRHGIGHHH